MNKNREEIHKNRIKETVALIRLEQKKRRKIKKQIIKLVEISLNPIFPSEICNHIGKFVQIKFALSKNIEKRVNLIWRGLGS